MGEEKKLSLDRIGRIATAVQVIGDNTLLDGKISYRIGLLGDYCASPLKASEKSRNKLIETSNASKLALVEAKTGDPIKDAILDTRGGILNNELNVKMSELGDEEVGVKIPELKLSDFIAKEEIKQVIKTKDKDGVDKNEIVIIKAGQALVPTRFFQLMGDLIIE